MNKLPALNIKYLIALLSIAIFIGACKSKKGLFGRKNKQKASDYTFYTDSIAPAIDYEYLSFKIQTKFDGDQINSPVKSVKSNVKIYKDSIVWASVTALLGIEAVRIQIKNDSVFMLNRLNSTYTYGPIHSFVKQLPAGTSLANVIQIMLGKSILPLEQISEDNLSSSLDSIKVNSSFNAGPPTNTSYTYSSTIKKGYPVLINQHIIDSSAAHYVKAKYTDFETVTIESKKHIIPFTQSFSIFNGAPITIVNSYSKLNTDKQTFNFKIPKNYDRIVY